MNAETVGSILFVDDEPSVLDALRRSLRRAPYRLRCATSAEEALLMLEQLDADIVVSDIDMPERDGLDLLTEIRQRHPDTVRMVLTGKPSLEACLRAINDGAIHRFFTKPVAREELLQGLRQGMAHQRLLLVARRLLQRCRAQMGLLRTQGVAETDRDADGAIRLDDLPEQIEELL